MYDETEAKASYYPEESTAARDSPMQGSTRQLHEAIDLVGSLAEKLGAVLSPVLRPTEPTPDKNTADLRSVGEPSTHVAELMKAKDRINVVSDRLRSLLERVEV